MNKSRRYGGRGLDRRTFIGLGSALAVSALTPRLIFGSEATPAVSTGLGPVRGAVVEGIRTFLGIPYAQPPVGMLRFMPPVKPEPSTTVFEALEYGHSAMQLSTGGSAVAYPGPIALALSQVFASRRDVQIQSEDCLALNVWTPSLDDSAKRPVMVWFHGGGFNYGSGSWPAYEGHHLARNHDVVVVTVNHRLNAFGYLDLSGIGDDRFSASGNAGMLDLVAALEWVRENIGAFGGDPDNVTIFGQSGGGAKVSTLMAMPAARGLFHRAIIQSGARLEADSTVDTARVSGDVLKELGISGDVSKLQEIPADNLLEAAAAVHQRYGPVMDGTILPTHPFEPEASPLGSDIPVIVGLTKDEATLYNVGHESWREMTEEELLAKSREEFPENADALLEAFRELHPGNAPRYLYTDLKTTEHYMRAVRLAERKAAQKSAPVFLYMFEWEAPVHDSMLRAPHTIEIPFIFDNVAKAPLLLGNDAATLQLGTAMSTIWSTFARTGRPEAEGLPEWPSYDSEDRATMVLNTTSRVANDHHGSVRKILSGA